MPAKLNLYKRMNFYKKLADEWLLLASELFMLDFIQIYFLNKKE